MKTSWSGERKSSQGPTKGEDGKERTQSHRLGLKLESYLTRSAWGMGALHSGVRTRRAGGGNDGNVTAGLFHRDLRGARWKTEEMQRAICSPWHTPNLPERLERNIQQKIKKKNIKQQQRENKLVFLFLLCNMVWLDEEEERCVRVFPEWTRSNRGVHDRRRRQHHIQNTVDVKLVV